MLALAALASKPFYTHDRGWGFLLVAVVCGSMILWCSYVAYTNFGPPAKRREEANRT
jgi:hypothetical protein